ncbi:aminoglycoside phosphotransferase family protein [Actinoplanes sp. KI2]|uniref:phosphotransferase family protein n=1 Tax=Actinoplanes sp. KI2 TaxID=2983315 RepID=UPI0021D5BF96|nr:aminoglycoside phosphotransferase family protein [Actinoplanes sp. KI2]MCU7725511.1 aminoglycoside phosphotransferase family protein [Actinoplanes sp. KI2]
MTSSPTQPSVSEEDIKRIVAEGLGAGLVTAEPLTGGTFAVVWRAALDDGRSVVVKVGPPASARLLRYEKDVIPAEAEYYTTVRAQTPDVPVPTVLAVSADPPWIIATMLAGTPLAEKDSPRARAELGAALARVHTITGPFFGYTGDRPSASDWPTAFAAIIDDIRADAADWNVPLPPLEPVVARYRDVLATVTRPALLHFDLWDGNVLAGPDGSLTGLVDGERFLYGDPLVDFVSPALGRRIEEMPDHPLLAGYRAGPFDESARIRLGLYRIFLYAIMIAEGPSRGIAIADGRHDHLTGLLTREVADLP